MRLAPALAIGLASTVFAPSVLAANGWEDSFPPDALATYLDSAGGTVLVAGAGVSVKPAAKALVAALTRTGKSRLVADDKLLGKISRASDADIVRKARSNPVDVVAVLRVFPAGASKPPTAVATFYDRKSGVVLSAFTVTRGTPLAPRVATAAVPTAAMHSVMDVLKHETAQHEQEAHERGGSGQEATGKETHEPETRGREEEARKPEPHEQEARGQDASTTRKNQEREKLLEEKGIWSSNTLIINAQTGGFMGQYTNFFRGKFGPRLDGAALFSYLGREDYARHYRSYMGARIGLLVGGGAAIIAGTVLLTVGLIQTADATLVPVVSGQCVTADSVTGSCTQAATSSMVWLGTGIGVVGSAAMIAGLIINPSPVSYDQLLQMVDGFNEKLKGGLGTSVPGASGDRDPPKVAWSVTSFSVPGGGGLALAARF